MLNKSAPRCKVHSWFQVLESRYAGALATGSIFAANWLTFTAISKTQWGRHKAQSQTSNDANMQQKVKTTCGTRCSKKSGCSLLCVKSCPRMFRRFGRMSCEAKMTDPFCHFDSGQVTVQICSNDSAKLAIESSILCPCQCRDEACDLRIMKGNVGTPQTRSNK